MEVLGFDAVNVTDSARLGDYVLASQWVYARCHRPTEVFQCAGEFACDVPECKDVQLEPRDSANSFAKVNKLLIRGLVDFYGCYGRGRNPKGAVLSSLEVKCFKF